jgi:glycosyltransferase involved in cell wall biosynthesis
MKILYLIDNYSLGGAQTVVKGIMDNNISDRLIFSVALRKKVPTIEINHPNSISIQSKSKYSFLPLIFLKKFIKSNRIEIIHCQLPRSIIFGYILKRFFYPGLKYIIHEQGDIFESLAYTLLLRIVSKKADRIIACSNATALMMEQRSGVSIEKIFIIYNFVDLKRFTQNTITKSEMMHIGFAGRIEKRKGWREFLYAASELKSDPRFKFYMAGTGKDTDKLINKIAELKVTNVEYQGLRKDMERFYQSIDILVIPSHFEPMGMVAVEAMASGISIIASDVPGLNEVVINGRNGWLIKPRSVEELVRAIIQVFETGNQEREHYIKTGLEDVKEFSYSFFYQKIKTLHNILLNEKYK